MKQKRAPQPVPPPRRKRGPIRSLFLFLAGLVGICCLTGFALAGLDAVGIIKLPTLAPTKTATATRTPTATATATVTLTPSSTFTPSVTPTETLTSTVTLTLIPVEQTNEARTATRYAINYAASATAEERDYRLTRTKEVFLTFGPPTAAPRLPTDTGPVSTRPPAAFNPPPPTAVPVPAGDACPNLSATCSQLTCAQAYACLRAGNKSLDRDGDGKPCETQCGG